MPHITDNFEIESFYQGFNEPENDSNTLTIEEQLAIIKEVEALSEQAEAKFDNLKPIRLRVRKMKKVTI